MPKKHRAPTNEELRLREKLDAHLIQRAREYGFSERAIHQAYFGWADCKRDGLARTMNVRRRGKSHTLKLPVDRADEGFRRSVNKKTQAALIAEQEVEDKRTPESTARALAELMALADLILERSDEEINALLEYIKQRRERSR